MFDPSIFLQQLANNITIPASQAIPAIIETKQEIADIGTTAVAGIGGMIALGTGFVTNLLNERKKARKNEDYVSEADKLLFQNIKEDYGDFSNLCTIEKEMQDLALQPENQNKSYFELLSIVYDISTGETYGQRRAHFLLSIPKYNHEYYEVPSNDPLIKCPNPSNKIAATMTEIKKMSTDKN